MYRDYAGSVCGLRDAYRSMYREGSVGHDINGSAPLAVFKTTMWFEAGRTLGNLAGEDCW